VKLIVLFLIRLRWIFFAMGCTDYHRLKDNAFIRENPCTELIEVSVANQNFAEGNNSNC